MNNQIIVTKININDNKISYECTIKGDWNNVKCFNTTSPFFVEYNYNVENIPYSISIIPFLGNLLPLAYVFDAEIIIDEVDETFYNAIPKIRSGFHKMFPSLDLKGKVTAKKIVKNKYKNSKGAAFFSGGVDAWHTLINNKNNINSLITFIGSDIKLEDEEGANRVRENTLKVCQDYNYDNIFIKSNLKEWIDMDAIYLYIFPLVNDDWWHGFHNGIGLQVLMAPISFKYNYGNIYLASTFCKEDWGLYTCGSDPIIDNEVKWGSSRIIHYGYDTTREDKVKQIIEYQEKNNADIYLRVCFSSAGGINCCECEKCIRTITAIYGNKGDYKKLGFSHIDPISIINVWKDNKNIIFHKRLKDLLRKNYKYEELDIPFKVLYNIDFSRDLSDLEKTCLDIIEQNYIEKQNYLNEIENIYHSKTYKVGNILLWLPKKIKAIKREDKNIERMK